MFHRKPTCEANHAIPFLASRPALARTWNQTHKCLSVSLGNVKGNLFQTATSQSHVDYEFLARTLLQLLNMEWLIVTCKGIWKQIKASLENNHQKFTHTHTNDQ